MVTLKLHRISSTGKYGTFGALTVDGFPQCVTLEPYWRNNEFENSCVPTGTYKLIWYNSPKYGRTLCLEEVQGRTFILFHWGNLVGNTKGCILVAQRYGQLSCKHGILNSMAAFKTLIRKLEDETDMQLIITEDY